MSNTDTAGFDLTPYPSSWGVPAELMDRAVEMSADMVRAGVDIDTAASFATAYVRRATSR